ncbi:hypothetical protein EMIHUDRAFT_438129 [Emiliania huxleyi CCMP1516]|uniref:Uncharacterized protein n=2 Tax=Emiliania huxleyi TaxID=2903 RepID=A0A0D3IDF8_EMIH1|nr:hypothetical protein EMIHUDRAFT_438129 [Emiliania huxleyi CCMP1516]EOD09293.1 hypothetical protein EMIHUDRAFT_438129 [Emiliania huxleyi CCMP1516]|eukprot:XP_005761722.1 hypothetical protein EMIHUDRAFT_438129 [Emiliania huxleyi CCMP1516]
MAAFLLPALGFIAGRGCQRFGLPHATRSGPWCAADASSPQAALLSKMQAMLESGATESALLALLEKEQVGPAECGALLADIARLREEGSLPDAGDGELGDIDLSFGVEEEEEAEEGVIDLEPAAVAPTPTRGEQPWGRWENGERCASVSLYLDDAVKGRDVCCEVVEGWLLIRIDESREVLYEDGVWGGEEETACPSPARSPPRHRPPPRATSDRSLADGAYLPISPLIVVDRSAHTPHISPYLP